MGAPRSNNVTTSGVTAVPQPAKQSPQAKYGQGNDVHSQSPGSNSITTNYPPVPGGSKRDIGSPGSENQGLTTTRGYSEGATGFNPPVSDATVSSDGRRRVKTLAVPDGDPTLDGASPMGRGSVTNSNASD